MTSTEQQHGPRWIEYHRLDEIVGNEDNPKGHDLDELRAAMQRFGYTEPIMRDERTGKLVAGHGRTELMLIDQAAGADVPEGILVADDGMWLAPVTCGWSSADDIEAEAYIVAANQLTIAGGWLNDPLLALLQRVQGSEHGLTGIGFSDDGVADLLASMGAVPSLDELRDQNGAPEPEDFWPTLRFKVSPDMKQRYEKLCGGLGGSDTEHFAYLLEHAEKALTT